MGRKEPGVDERGENALLDGNPHDAATTSDTLALLRRTSPVFLFPRGPQRLLDNLRFFKHNSQRCWPDIYNTINRQCTKQCFTSKVLHPRQNYDVCSGLGGEGGDAKTLGCSTKITPTKVLRFASFVSHVEHEHFLITSIELYG